MCVKVLGAFCRSQIIIICLTMTYITLQDETYSKTCGHPMIIGKIYYGCIPNSSGSRDIYVGSVVTLTYSK